MKRTGFKIDDLVSRSAEDVNTRYGDHITEKALIDKRHAHYEEKRVAKLDILKKVRAEVLDEESKGTWNSQSKTKTMAINQSRMDSGSNVKSTLIEKELKQLEKIKFKQQK